MLKMDIRYIYKRGADMDKRETTCCFIGHRQIAETEKLRAALKTTIESLIVNEKVDTFLCGSKSRFNDLCLELVTEIKKSHPHVKRVYVRAEYPIISEEYEKYLLKCYEETYFPQKLAGAGRSVYVQRNIEMIKESGFCIVYLLEGERYATRKSGTKIAAEYASRQGCRIIKFP